MLSGLAPEVLGRPDTCVHGGGCARARAGHTSSPRRRPERGHPRPASAWSLLAATGAQESDTCCELALHAAPSAAWKALEIWGCRPSHGRSRGYGNKPFDWRTATSNWSVSSLVSASFSTAGMNCTGWFDGVQVAPADSSSPLGRFAPCRNGQRRVSDQAGCRSRPRTPPLGGASHCEAVR